MDRLTKDNLQELLSSQTGNAATIYIPTHTTASPPHITENQIRLKNLLHKAADELRRQSSTQLATKLDQLVDQYHDDLSFWESQTPGLLVCASDNTINMYHLPVDTEEYVAVDKTFHLAPLLGLMQDEKDFYVLALAQHDPVLYKGNFYGLEASGIELPVSVKDALNIDEPNQKSENQGTANAPSTNTGWFNGRGGARNPQEEDRMRYFRMIDKIIHAKADCSLPMIVAGIESETVEYKKISKYPVLLKQIIAGNHTADDMRPLFDKAMPIIQRELVMPEHQAAIQEYQQLSGANPARTASDSKSIQDAAGQGRVDKLLTRMSRKTADTVRDKLDRVTRITFPDAKEAKKLNAVAMTVWQNSGRVYNLMPEEMPNGALMAARLRY